MIFDFFKLGLQLFQVRFQIRRLLLATIGSQANPGQLFGDLLLAIEVVLLPLEQIGRNAFSNRCVCLTKQIQKRTRARLLRDPKSLGSVLQGLSRQCFSAVAGSRRAQQGHLSKGARGIVEHVFRRTQKNSARLVRPQTTGAQRFHGCNRVLIVSES